MSIRLYFIALCLILAFDLLWIRVLAKNFYKIQIGFLMKSDINWLAAILFYLIFICGLVLFVIQPAIDKHSWRHSLLFGALYGLFTYATYDLTNLATLKSWPILVTLVDLSWGIVLSGLVSVITYFICY